MKTYPLGERFVLMTKDIRYVWTGEKRPPKNGEYYLSGAIIEAYKAPNDLSQSFHIAKPVKVKLVPEHYEIID